MKIEMSRVVAIANGIMLVLFVSWAGFQYNDPDSLLWIAMYGLAALGCLLYFRRLLPRAVAWTFVVICLAGALYLAVRIAAAGEFIFDESGREMMGLLVCAGWIGFLVRKGRTSKAGAA